MTGTPLIIGPEEIAALEALAKTAFLPENVADIHDILRMCATPEGKRKHMDRMNSQTLDLPFGFRVTFSVESGQPIGTCRHMSMSSPKLGRVPSPQAVWMVAEHLGFMGSILDCKVWEEDLQRGPDTWAAAINIVQPVRQ